ncbi:MAG TPA: tetratricopeptide repeat protein [Nannocystaceae bacterium]|nr:tetratricopeptide repeat protein [Nannocystaceae bacterium]
MRVSTPFATTVRTRAHYGIGRGVGAAVILAVASAHPLPALASGPAKDELPTVTDEPTPPPGEDEVRDEPNLERAMEAFQRGSQNYNEAQYQQALRDFLEAASLYASPDFQYNIGLCYEKLDKPEEAIAAFETYLKTKPEAADRANVEDRIERLRGMAEQRRAGGGSKPPEDTRKAKSTAARPMLITGDVLTGVGIVVALAGGIGFGVAAKRKSDALKDVQTGGNPDDLTLADARDLESQGKTFEAIQIAMVAVGGALVVTGVALIAVGTVRRNNAKKGKSARARLVPVVGARGAGLSLTGRF